MSEPRVIITHLSTLRAMAEGGHNDPGQFAFPKREGDKIYSSEDVKLISPLEFDQDGFLAVDTDTWAFHDPDDVGAPLVYGGTCRYCTSLGKTHRLTNGETTWLIVALNYCPDCTPKRLTRCLLPSHASVGS